MGQADVLKLAQDAIKTIFKTASPMLIISLIVGLIVSIIQAVTQIQEATLAFVPKILAVFLSLIIFGPWILQEIIEFTVDLWTNISLYIQ